MESETSHYVKVVERLGRKALMELANLPEISLRWPLPLPNGDPLVRRALRLFEESAFWVLEVVDGQNRLADQGEKGEANGTYNDLILRFECWLSSLQQALDRLPDANLDLLVEVPAPYRDSLQVEKATIRACLLYAAEQCAMYVEHIQFICQLFADGERVIVEVTELSRESIVNDN